MNYGAGQRKPLTEDQVQAARKLDDDLSGKQLEALIEQLESQGRHVAADLVDSLVRDLQVARNRIAYLEAAAAKKRPGKVKTSGGRDYASARGTINSGGKAVNDATGRAFTPARADHKHDYNAEGICRRFTAAGVLCGAKRQRQSKKSRQTTIPGTDNGAKPASEVTP